MANLGKRRRSKVSHHHNHQRKVFRGSASHCACGCRRRKTNPRRRYAPGCNTEARNRLRNQQITFTGKPGSGQTAATASPPKIRGERGHSCGIKSLAPRERGKVQRWADAGTLGMIKRTCGCLLKVVPHTPTFCVRGGDVVEVWDFAKDNRNTGYWLAKQIEQVQGEE